MEERVSITLPMGCSFEKHTNYYGTIDGYGGDINKKPTCKLRNLCTNNDGKVVMIGDHLWVSKGDCQKIIDMPKGFPEMKTNPKNGRPKRGNRIAFRAKCRLYQKVKVKLVDFRDLKWVKENYWTEGCLKNDYTDLWHTGTSNKNVMKKLIKTQNEKN